MITEFKTNQIVFRSCSCNDCINGEKVNDRQTAKYFAFLQKHNLFKFFESKDERDNYIKNNQNETNSINSEKR